MSKQTDIDNHSNQLNPNNNEFWNSRESGSDDEIIQKSNVDNHSNQLNPNNEAYLSNVNK